MCYWSQCTSISSIHLGKQKGKPNSGPQLHQRPHEESQEVHRDISGRRLRNQITTRAIVCFRWHLPGRRKTTSIESLEGQWCLSWQKRHPSREQPATCGRCNFRQYGLQCPG